MDRRKTGFLSFIFALICASQAFAEESKNGGDASQIISGMPKIVDSIASGQPSEKERDEQAGSVVGPCQDGSHSCLKDSEPEFEKEEIPKPTVADAEVDEVGKAIQECVDLGQEKARTKVEEYRSWQEQDESFQKNADVNKYLTQADECLGPNMAPDACRNAANGKSSGNRLHGACSNLVALEGLAKQLESTQEQVASGNVKNYGTAQDHDTIKHDGIFEITKTFLKEQGLNPDVFLTKYCATENENDGNSQSGFNYLSFLESNETDEAEHRVYAVSQCIKGDDALYPPSKGKENWKFFTNFSGDIGQPNYKKICEDHAYNNCLPVRRYYKACGQLAESVGVGEQQYSPKNRCQLEARESMFACIRGDYGKVYLPAQSELDTNLLTRLYQPDKFPNDVRQPKMEEDKENFLSLAEFKAQSRSPEIVEQELTFSGFFHDAYATCTILRRASQAMANGEKSISITEEVVSTNGRNKCFRQVPWTVDFNYCVNTMEWGDGAFDIANAFGSTGIAMKESMNESEISQNLAKDAASGDQTAYINAQKERLENSKENDYIRSGIAGTHAVALGGAATYYPTPSDLAEACDSAPRQGVRLYGDSDLNCAMAWVAVHHEQYGYEKDEIHVPRKDGSSKNLMEMMFSNQQIRKSFFHKAATKMAESIFHGVLGRQKGKQANDLDAIKKQYDEFFGQPAITPEYAGVNYCQQNPTAPSCRGSSRTSGAKLETGFESSGFQGQGGGNFSFNKIQDGFETEEKLTEAERKARERLGDIIGNGGGNEFGDDIAPPGAAKGKYGKAGAGGGPGGGAGGAGGAGGGKAPGPKKDNGKKTAQGMTKGKVNYQAGSGGINWKPGNSSRSKKKDRNAFQSMFGNKQNRNVATVLEGVSPASSKLFEKISKAYNKVKEEKKIYDFSKEDE